MILRIEYLEVISINFYTLYFVLEDKIQLFHFFYEIYGCNTGMLKFFFYVYVQMYAIILQKTIQSTNDKNKSKSIKANTSQNHQRFAIVSSITSSSHSSALRKAGLKYRSSLRSSSFKSASFRSVNSGCSFSRIKATNFIFSKGCNELDEPTQMQQLRYG